MSLMYMQMGLKALGTLGSFAEQKIQTDLNKSVQTYRNTMAALSAAQSNNVVVSNEIQARDAAVRQGVTIEKQALMDTENAKVAAATAGVSGGSVDAVARNLKASAINANKSRLSQLAMQMRAYNQEKRNIAVTKAYSKDISVIPKPSTSSMLLGLGMQMIDTHDMNVPEGDRIMSDLSFPDFAKKGSDTKQVGGRTAANTLLDKPNADTIGSGGLY